jgi:hypothetical protein
MKGIIPRALIVVVGLSAAWSPAAAQRLACASIKPGETASAVARRITGDARNSHAPWFQILNPESSRFVDKARYDHVRPGWRACVVSEPAKTESRVLVDAPVAVRAPTAFSAFARRVDARGSTLVLLAALFIVLPIVWSGVCRYLDARQRVLDEMQRFGETFILEFERPLIQPDRRERPIQSRLRASPERRQLEIFLAPNGRSRYPNLSDHQKNVEYDVTRVLQMLRDRPFVCRPVYARGRWVIVPFQFRLGPKQAGVE